MKKLLSLVTSLALAFTLLVAPAYAIDSVEVSNADQLIEALEAGKSVVFTDDIKINPANMSNAYGKTGINVKNGQTIDGAGYTLDIKGAGGTWDSGINTTGGLIKNLTVTGSFRGIFINHNSTHSEPVVLENVTIDGTTYTISCDQGSNQGLIATNCTFNGWTSYAGTLGKAKFVNCNFGEGNGYAFMRPYAPTEYVDCHFEKGFEIDARNDVDLVNCYLDDKLITNSNIGTLVTGNKDNAATGETIQLQIYRNGNTEKPYKTVTLPQVLKGEKLNLTTVDVKDYYNSSNGFKLEGLYNDGGWNSYLNGNPNNVLGDEITINGWTNLKCMVTDYQKVVVKAVTDGDKENAQTISTTLALTGDNLLDYLNDNVTIENRTGYTLDKWYNWDYYGHKFDENRTINGWTNVYVTYTKDYVDTPVTVGFVCPDCGTETVRTTLNGLYSDEVVLTTDKLNKLFAQTRFAEDHIITSVEGGGNYGGTANYFVKLDKEAKSPAVLSVYYKTADGKLLAAQAIPKEQADTHDTTATFTASDLNLPTDYVLTNDFNETLAYGEHKMVTVVVEKVKTESTVAVAFACPDGCGAETIRFTVTGPKGDEITLTAKKVAELFAETRFAKDHVITSVEGGGNYGGNANFLVRLDKVAKDDAVLSVYFKTADGKLIKAQAIPKAQPTTHSTTATFTEKDLDLPTDYVLTNDFNETLAYGEHKMVTVIIEKVKAESTVAVAFACPDGCGAETLRFTVNGIKGNEISLSADKVNELFAETRFAEDHIITSVEGGGNYGGNANFLVRLDKAAKGPATLAVYYKTEDGKLLAAQVIQAEQADTHTLSYTFTNKDLINIPEGYEVVSELNEEVAYDGHAQVTVTVRKAAKGPATLAVYYKTEDGKLLAAQVIQKEQEDVNDDTYTFTNEDLINIPEGYEVVSELNEEVAYDGHAQATVVVKEIVVDTPTEDDKPDVDEPIIEDVTKPEDESKEPIIEEVTPTPEKDPVVTPEKDPTKTGDNSNIVLFAGLAVLAAGAMFVLRRKEEL